MLDRLGADRCVGVRQRAELVGERLAGRVREGVRVHRVEPEAELGGARAERGRVGPVPGDVQRDGRRRAGQLVDDGAVAELVEDVARLAGAGEAREARAAGADAPGRHRDGEGGDPGLHRLDVDAAAVELRAERGVVLAERGLAAGVLGRDQGGIDLGHASAP